MVLENYHHNTEGKGAKGGDSVVEVMDDGVRAGADVQGITGGDGGAEAHPMGERFLLRRTWIQLV